MALVDEIELYQKQLIGPYILNVKLPDQGGMGTVFFAVNIETHQKVVIKFFNHINSSSERSRFKREVRLLKKYTDNNSEFTIPILDFELEIEIPYFVMPLASSDLTKIELKDNSEIEKTFLRMIDCLDYVHEQGDIHRDVKPENFLVINGSIVISDMGLAKDPSSETRFTQSVHKKGTPIYCSPRFFEDGGFKNATITDDLFSLGKTFYFLLTGIPPYYIRPNSNINGNLFHIIRRLTSMDENEHYKNSQELRKDVVLAFDMLIGRTNNMSFLYQNWNELSHGDMAIMLFNLNQLHIQKKIEFIEKSSPDIFKKLASSTLFDNATKEIISIYGTIVDFITTKKGGWDFSYAERVARDMAILFQSKHVSSENKAQALEVALEVSIKFNRHAAEEICGHLIESIDNDVLAILCARVIDNVANNRFLENFVSPFECRHQLIQKLAQDASPNISL